MARQDQVDYSRELSLSNDPAAANSALLESAGQHQGQANVIAGKSDAQQTTFWGNMALEAHKGYTLAELEKGIREITDRTYNPTTSWKGKMVDSQNEATRESQLNRGIDIAATNEQEAAVWNSFGDGGDSESKVKELNSYKDRLSSIASAQENGVLSPDEARARIGSLMRKSIAAAPGLADHYRKLAVNMTGVQGLDTAEVELGLDSRSYHAALQKQNKMEEHFYKATVAETAKRLSITEVQAHQVLQNPAMKQHALSVVNARQAQERLVQEAEQRWKGKEITSKESMEGLKTNIDNGVFLEASAMSSTMSLQLAEQGLKFEDIIDGNGRLKSNMDSSKVAAVNSIVNGHISGLTRMYDKAINNIDAARASGVLSKDMADYRKDLIERRNEVIKMTTDSAQHQSGLNLLKLLRTNEGETFDMAAKRANLFLKLKEASGGDQVWAMFLDPATKDAMTARNPELAKMVDQTIAGTFDQIKPLLGVAAHMNAVATGQQTPEAAAATPKEKALADKQIISSSMDLLQQASQNVNGGTTFAHKITPEESRKLLRTFSSAPPTGNNLKAMATPILSGSVDVLFKDDTKPAYTTLNKNVSNYLFSKVDEQSYPARIQSLLNDSKVNGKPYLAVKVDDNGRLYAEDTRTNKEKFIQGGAVGMLTDSNYIPTSTHVELMKVLNDANTALELKQYSDKKMGIEPAGAADAKSVLDAVSKYVPKSERPNPQNVSSGTIKQAPTTAAEGGERGNNFLNLRVPGKTDFQSFKTPEEAVSAYSTQLDRYISGKTTGKALTTVGDIVGTWNNEKESGSMSKANYLKVIEEKIGLGAGEAINTPAEKAQLIWAMQFAESGKEKMSLASIRKALDKS